MIFEKKIAYISWLPVLIQALSVIVLSLVLSNEEMLVLSITLLSGTNVLLYAMMLFFRELRYPYSDSGQYRSVNVSPLEFIRKEIIYVASKYQFVLINCIALLALGLVGSSYLKPAFWGFSLLFVGVNIFWLLFSCVLKLKRGAKVANNFLTGFLFFSVFQIQMTTFFETPSVILVNPLSSAVWLTFFGDGAVLICSVIVFILSILTAVGFSWKSDLRYWE